MRWCFESDVLFAKPVPAEVLLCDGLFLFATVSASRVVVSGATNLVYAANPANPIIGGKLMTFSRCGKSVKESYGSNIKTYKPTVKTHIAEPTIKVRVALDDVRNFVDRPSSPFSSLYHHSGAALAHQMPHRKGITNQPIPLGKKERQRNRS
jgi:hypothetical protein